MIMDRLYDKAKKRGPVCLGLDTDLSYLPACIAKEKISTGEQLFRFNKEIIDQTKDLVACYKVQIAYYEALGMEGMEAYRQTMAYIRQQGEISIGDVKRGDIAATAQKYAKGHFEGDFETDIITVNGYMGEDAISPFYPYLKEKGLFVLLRTSNKSAVDLQDVDAGGQKVFLHMGDLIATWGKAFMGDSGFSAIGAVVGLTYPEEFELLAQTYPNMFFLVPGYGAQGGTGKDLARVLKKSSCAVVNSSRGLITAHKGKSDDWDFAQYVRTATFTMKEDIVSWL
ncbi:orotidine-5'-phosphate decarboxylase [Alkalibacter rhizosphaerae]|uniref:Orotidine 5'-phosphate decarboxylase n=1 Tax=Alkalibacter rhizosphaerae TaxID=2815577 RepID=A0A974XKQ8_9FIRM|nr:orotidine-5'-phosphate decarboxylase [Alkalibacter rhizosphaerae]QSX07756.1 orotidine-5'-phosphate decarboxylase [Alkalibacter rhizosphaerae]